MSTFRLAAIGDGLIGPLIHAGRGEAGPERTFIDNRFVNWLRVLLPEVEIGEDAVLGTPGETTVAVAQRVAEVLDLDSVPHAVLICAGIEDCLAAPKGTAPSADSTVGGLESIAALCLAAGVAPLFVVPPPCELFSNGLFADRYVAIAATLRRMQRHDPRIGLIDPTGLLMRRGAFGIEPDPAFVAAGAHGRLSALGAFRLAELAAEYLRHEFAGQIGGAPELTVDGALNANPRLAGFGGAVLSEAVSGRCPTGYQIQTHDTGGAAICLKRDRRRLARRLTMSGRYTTGWGFIQLNQQIDSDTIGGLSADDVIEAYCDFELSGPVENIASVSLHATVVWANDFVGLHSTRYVGGLGVARPHGGRLRTPRFKLTARPVKLHVSCQVHLRPGADLTAGGQLDLKSMVLRQVEVIAPAHRAVIVRDDSVESQVRSAI